MESVRIPFSEIKAIVNELKELMHWLVIIPEQVARNPSFTAEVAETSFVNPLKDLYDKLTEIVKRHKMISEEAFMMNPQEIKKFVSSVVEMQSRAGKARDHQKLK